ncbi:MAG: tRNA (adenosine(37)-N6)-threonylcarbamoyltransferase complex ATPase subunit type 1 TsaE [candidate division KSB1 bacterium]|nr:tRNA (adenosine(37)-N6)-threonylcarbamoyltransferase complex ATPase subunit type 1 TsaE [candidate division KSB1 bacterium]
MRTLLESEGKKYKKVLTRSEKETFQLGVQLAPLLRPGDVVALIGELGSGKTCLIQGICYGLGVKEPVTSPSFVLINEYQGRLAVYHFDFYRLTNEADIWALGCEDYFYGSGVCLIEWADRAFHILPSRRIEIRLRGLFKKGLENSREIEIQIFDDSVEKGASLRF